MHTVKEAPPPIRTLEAWLTLEVLSPQKLPKPKDLEASGRQLIRLDDYSEPWKHLNTNPNPREKDHYWFVFLGELNLKAAIESLLKIFPNKGGGEFRSLEGEATMGAIVLDSKGKPVEDKSFLSSFAWGYGKVRAGDLKNLHSFIDDEETILEAFNKKLIIQNEDGIVTPVNKQHINNLCDWLIEKLNLPQEHISKPGIAVRVPIWSDNKEVPEPELLNSFFLEDLYRVKKEYEENRTIGKALATYMEAKSEKKYADIANDESLLKNTLRPSRLPLSRWPVKGRHPLYMMQQVAVNHITEELNESGMAAINGPPGTGKTTLLRDIIANVVFNRASILAAYENPEKAFSHAGKIRTGNAFSHLYNLDKCLLGHEIVVASSNNKAVENISKDIPGVNEVADDFSQPLRYFSTAADSLAASKDEKKNKSISSRCWGTAAAVLGNSANRNTFVNDFWWNTDFGMRAYLSSVGKEINDNSPQISRLENAPETHQQAIDNWNTTRNEFNSQKKELEEKILELEKINDSLLIINDVIENREQASRNYNESLEDLIETHKLSIVLNNLYESCAKEEKSSLILLSATGEIKPGFFSKLFRTKAYKKWEKDFSEILDKIKIVTKEKLELGKRLSLAESNHEKAKSTKEQMAGRLKKAKKEHELNIKNIETGKKLLDKNFPDDDFWKSPETIKQKLSPWIDTYLQNERDELFVMSFKVHRAFVDAAAKQIRNNLNTMMLILKNGNIDSEYEATISSLWASLFLVVPVISTTFASFSRLFSTLQCEEIGWLLLDESGQALPQAAVGALWRSKRAVVIGDPLQIEPVVTIPNQLIKAIFDEYYIEVDDWAPPVMSVQTLADRTSWFGSMVEMNGGEIWVGSPLRVHRRCVEPMFSISNEVAYNGLMVSDTPESDSIIGNHLGDSSWLDIESQSIAKWSRDEGRLVISLLHNLFDNGIVEPDIFIISPFKNIADQLKNMIKHDVKVKNYIGKDNIWKWTTDRVGTVHTFQGKEAEAVVFVLGATGNEFSGSRVWAGKTPNILNVAITRAKNRLYVIGNNADWQTAGMFSVLSRSLTKIKTSTTSI
jgi:hypothetical protein